MQFKKLVKAEGIYEKYKQDISPEIIRSYFGQSIKSAEIDKLIVEYQKWVEQFKN